MIKKRHLVAVTALVAAGLTGGPSSAHESRVLGAKPTDTVSPSAIGVNVRVSVGFSGEPAFEDTFNGLDLFLFTYDGECPIDKSDFYGNPITSATGDTIDVKAEALYLAKSLVPTGVTGNVAPPGILKSLVITDISPLHGVFGDPGHYHSDYKPTHPGNPEQGGAYGFHVYGTVTTKDSKHTCDASSSSPTTKTIPARSVKIDTYWVCEAGFRVPQDGPASTVARGQFNCIDPVQVFPGDPRDGYQPNKPYNAWRY